MGRRTVLLVAALIVAALGTTAVFAYVRGADKRALKDQSPVEVLVAKSIIRAGTPVADAERQGSFVTEELPRTAVAPGALSSTVTIDSLVAASDIFPGEQILAAKFSAVGSVGALPIPSGKMAMSVQLGDPQRVAGFVQPGADVAVFVTIRPDVVQGGRQEPEFTRVLLPRVQVIAVGPTTFRSADNGNGDGNGENAGNKEALPTAILTLAVEQAQGQRLVYAARKGELHFALLSKDSKVTTGGAVDIRNLFG